MNKHWKTVFAAALGLIFTGVTAQAYPITILADDFDDKEDVPGTLLSSTNNVPQVGTLWESPNLPDEGAWVQDDYAASGNALRITRPDGVGARQLFLGSTNANNQIEANTEAIFTFDFFRLDTTDDIAISLDIGGHPSANSPGLYAHGPNLRWYYMDYDTGTWELMDDLGNDRIGTNGWSTLEIVLKWGDVVDGKLPGSYDVYHSRTAENSEGYLERTLLKADAPINNDLFEPGDDYSLVFAPQNDSVAYFDNVDVTVIPEPSMAALLAGGLGILWFKLRRR